VIGMVCAVIGLVSGLFGGLIAAVMLELHMGRRASEEVGEYDRGTG
jgi:uncharacterized membrane protein YbjE (DUF340 family)